MSDAGRTYLDVLVPVPVSGTFTYRLPQSVGRITQPGCRVLVPFGKGKTVTGIIRRVHHEKPVDVSVRDVFQVLDKAPLVTESHLRFWQWIADYYLCTEGEVMDAALPAGLKPYLAEKYYINTEESVHATGLSPEEERVLECLRDYGPLSRPELLRSAGFKKNVPIPEEMVRKKLLRMETTLEGAYKPKESVLVCLNPAIKADKQWSNILDTLQRAPRQQEILMYLLEVREESGTSPEIEKKELLERYPAPSAVKALLEKGFIEEKRVQVSRLPGPGTKVQELKTLTGHQQKALNQVEQEFRSKNIVLLHGITSSGKTEIYFHLIRKMLREGKQVLYLMPEIAITAQMIRRLREVFGSEVAVYHSRYPEGERTETWLAAGASAGDPRPGVIVGVRSAIFLPFRDLGLIIIDEEHETTFKQQNPAPRYHARDMATVLSTITGARVLLGTATPSIESYYNARTGKYGLVELDRRYTEVALPEIRIVDMKKAYNRGETKSHLSRQLFQAMHRALEENEQVILFQNRRGFSPFIQCNHCGWIPYCRHCDVRLTYHRHSASLICHYCGYREPVPATCPRCQSPDIRTRGFGTEKIEEDLTLLFPEAKILRLDLDTAQNRSRYEKIITKFENHEADILVGTQMITKGLDFRHVQVVGILNADNLLHFPDFRAWERSYQLITQVSGRSGRAEKRGLVFIQTWDPEHPVLKDIVSGDYDHMYRTQLEERKAFGYPPYFRLIKIQLRHRDPQIVAAGASQLAGLLRKRLKHKVLGPESPVIPRIRNLWEKQILLKIRRESHLPELRKQITEASTTLTGEKRYRRIRIIFDVDPV